MILEGTGYLGVGVCPVRMEPTTSSEFRTLPVFEVRQTRRLLSAERTKKAAFLIDFWDVPFLPKCVTSFAKHASWSSAEGGPYESKEAKRRQDGKDSPRIDERRASHISNYEDSSGVRH